MWVFQIQIQFIKIVIWRKNYKLNEEEFIKIGLRTRNYKLALEEFIILEEAGKNYKLLNIGVSP